MFRCSPVPGSGKTYVLMKRFVQILRSDLSVNPTNIVAITFTRKAADEIKGRVRQAVSECVEQAQNDLERLRWQEHLQKVESAPISTIHSLCSRILRDNPVETQLDPEFTILEDFEAQDFFKETLQQYLRKNIKENAALRRLVQTYGVNSFVNQVTALGTSCQSWCVKIIWQSLILRRRKNCRPCSRSCLLLCAR